MKTQVSKFARAAIVAGSVALASTAHAAIDISAGVTEAKTDIGTAGGLIIGVVLAVAAIFWIRRVIK